MCQQCLYADKRHASSLWFWSSFDNFHSCCRIWNPSCRWQSICVVICDPWRAWRTERNFTHTHFELRVTFWTSIYRVSYGDSISANKPRLEPLSSSLNLSTEVGKHAPNCLDSLSRVLKLSTVDCKRAVTREIICYSLRDVMKIPRYSPIPKPTPS